MPIEVRTHPQEETRGGRSCFWIAECVLEDGRPFTARSQHGALNELARQLVAAGIPDQPMQAYDQRGLKAPYYRSFQAPAKWTYTEGNGLLQRVPYRSPEEIASGLQRQPKNGVEPDPDVSQQGAVSAPPIVCTNTARRLLKASAR